MGDEFISKAENKLILYSLQNQIKIEEAKYYEIIGTIHLSTSHKKISLARFQDENQKHKLIIYYEAHDKIARKLKMPEAKRLVNYDIPDNDKKN